MKAKNIGVEREDVSMISSHPDTIIDIHDLDAEYRNFKIYEMNIMEKNTHDLFKSTEESKETKAFNEKATTPSKNNLKIENTQLIAGFTYQMKNTDWKKFKSNFSINFERMMVLSFSELFDGTTKL